MNTTEIARLFDEYVAAWQRDDQQEAMSFWSDDIVMVAPGSNPHSGVYRGKAEVQRNLIDRIFAETIAAEVLGVVDKAFGSEHVFTIVHELFQKADGRVLDTKRILLYRWSDQKIVEVRYFDPDQAAADEFWSN